MDNLLAWATLPTLGALIGWITNVVAIRMLFRPRKMWRMPGTGWVVQGVIPRRQADLAKAIAETVTGELLPMEELLARLNFSDSQGTLVKHVGEHMDRRLHELLAKYVPGPLRELLAPRLLPRLREIVEHEADGILQEAIGPLQQMIREELHMKEIIEQKVAQFRLEELERIIYRVVGHELRYVEILGGVLGGVIGVCQVLILTFLG